MFHLFLAVHLERDWVLIDPNLSYLSFLAGAVVFVLFIGLYYSSLVEEIRLIRGGYSEDAIDQLKKVMAGIGCMFIVFLLGFLPSAAILLILALLKLLWTLWTALALIIEDTKIPNAIRRLLGFRERPNLLRSTTGG